MTAYNHNGRHFARALSKIVSTHTFEDRLATIDAAARGNERLLRRNHRAWAKTESDRLRMLEVLWLLRSPPESVPINCLVPMPGTPLEHREPVDTFELVRLIGHDPDRLALVRRCAFGGPQPAAREAAGALLLCRRNSIFYGDKLLTASNPSSDATRIFFAPLDLQTQTPSVPQPVVKIAIGSDHAGYSYKQQNNRAS